MFDRVKQFATSEDGAVSVDWVVLTAAILFLGLAIGITVRGPAMEKGVEIGAEVAAMKAL